jgi:DNA-binding Xre family transcriptional regulator
MAISYNGLWKLMIDKNLQKKNLIEDLNISSATIAKMGKGESVSVDVLERICGYMGCNIGDIMSFEIEETKEVDEKR